MWLATTTKRKSKKVGNKLSRGEPPETSAGQTGANVLACPTVSSLSVALHDLCNASCARQLKRFTISCQPSQPPPTRATTRVSLEEEQPGTESDDDNCSNTPSTLAAFTVNGSPRCQATCEAHSVSAITYQTVGINHDPPQPPIDAPVCHAFWRFRHSDTSPVAGGNCKLALFLGRKQSEL